MRSAAITLEVLRVQVRMGSFDLRPLMHDMISVGTAIVSKDDDIRVCISKCSWNNCRGFRAGFLVIIGNIRTTEIMIRHGPYPDILWESDETSLNPLEFETSTWSGFTSRT